MTDIKEEKTIAAPAQNAQPAPSSAQTEIAPIYCEPAHRTVGNKIFDWGVYSSIAFAGVSLVSMLTAHEAIHGTNKNFKWLRTINAKITSGVRSAFSKTIMRKPAELEKVKAWEENIDHWAKGSSMFTMLGLGGTTLMGPIKWMEDNRLYLSGKIDKALGTTPPDAEAITHEPKQTWKSVLTGRAISVFISFLAFVGMGPKIADKLTTGCGDLFAQGWLKLRPATGKSIEAAAAYEKNVRKWAHLGAFDTLFTAITASILYVTSRFVANRNNIRQDSDDVMMTIDPETPTPQHPVSTPEAAKTRHTQRIQPRAKVTAPETLYTQKLAVAADSATLAPGL